MLSLYTKIQNALAARRDDETGATAVEYGVMVALIAAVIVGVVTTLGTEVQGTFQDIVDAIPG